MSEITTDKFRINSQQYFRVEAYNLTRKLFWGITFLLFLSIGLSILNIYFLYIGLILFFIVIPPAIAFIYFNKLLTDDAQRNLAEKSLVIVPGKIIEIKFDNDRLSDYSIPWNSIATVNYLKKMIELRDRNGKLLLIIPKLFITSSNCFDEFSTDMNWDEKKID